MSHVLQIRVSEVLHEALKEIAAREGKTVSEVCRNRLERSIPNPDYVDAEKAQDAMRNLVFKESVLTITKSKVCSTCGHETEHWAYDANGKAVCNECVLKAYPMVKI